MGKGEAECGVESVRCSEPTVLAGDARADTTGHNAKFSSYTYMHADGYHTPGSRKIVDVQLLQMREVKNANDMAVGTERTQVWTETNHQEGKSASDCCCDRLTNHTFFNYEERISRSGPCDALAQRGT